MCSNINPHIMLTVLNTVEPLNKGQVYWGGCQRLFYTRWYIFSCPLYRDCPLEGPLSEIDFKDNDLIASDFFPHCYNPVSISY